MPEEAWAPANESAPSVTFRGKVLNEDTQEALIGTKIIVKDIGGAFLGGAMSDVEGEFSITIPNSQGPLQVECSIIGFETVYFANVPYNDQSFTVRLHEQRIRGYSGGLSYTVYVD